MRNSFCIAAVVMVTACFLALTSAPYSTNIAYANWDYKKTFRIAPRAYRIAPPHSGGQNVFQKIGDGWLKGQWIPGLPNIRPQTWQEVVFPICWGSPQDCRGSTTAKAGPSRGPLYFVTFRVDCRDKDNGSPRGDSTITFTSTTSLEDAGDKAWNAYNTSDLCQIDPNYQDPSRVMVPGSGRIIDE